MLELLRDYREGRPRILTDNYSAYRVESGGAGDGTVIAYHFAAGGRERDYRLRVEESTGELLERDELSSFISTWSVASSGSGSEVHDRVLVGGGRRGRRILRADVRADRACARIYGQMLERLAGAVGSA